MDEIEFRWRLGQNFKRARNAAGRTQGHLSDLTGVDRAKISMMENGKVSCGTYRLAVLCEAIGAKIEDVIPRVKS
jgi:transcriptional regulator with XRE-family HTH domain